MLESASSFIEFKVGATVIYITEVGFCLMTSECLGNRVISTLQCMHVGYTSWLCVQSGICVGEVVHHNLFSSCHRQ